MNQDHLEMLYKGTPEELGLSEWTDVFTKEELDEYDLKILQYYKRKRQELLDNINSLRTRYSVGDEVTSPMFTTELKVICHKILFLNKKISIEEAADDNKIKQINAEYDQLYDQRLKAEFDSHSTNLYKWTVVHSSD